MRKAGAEHKQLRGSRGGHTPRRVLLRLVRRLLVLPVGASGAAIPAAAAAAAAAAADAAAVCCCENASGCVGGSTQSKRTDCS